MQQTRMQKTMIIVKIFFPGCFSVLSSLIIRKDFQLQNKKRIPVNQYDRIGSKSLIFFSSFILQVIKKLFFSQSLWLFYFLFHFVCFCWCFPLNFLHNKSFFSFTACFLPSLPSKQRQQVAWEQNWH